jgi:hypothetical protein
MDEKTKATLTNLETWKRGLFMILFAIISGVAKLIVTLVAVFQFVTVLFKGQVNPAMLPFGQNLSTYLYQITLFLTFKTDEMPFPFVTFPDGTPESNLSNDDKEDIGANEATTKNEGDTADVAEEEVKVEDIQDEIETKKDVKDDSSNS